MFTFHTREAAIEYLFWGWLFVCLISVSFFEILTIGPGYMLLTAGIWRLLRPISEEINYRWADSAALVLSVMGAAVVLWLVINGTEALEPGGVGPFEV